MKILYISTLCSIDKYKYLFDTAIEKPAQAANKFHTLLAKGFEANGCSVDTLSTLSISRSTHSKLCWGFEREKCKGMTYNYLPFVNLPILRQLFICVGTFLYTLFWSLKGDRKDSVVVCDVLNIATFIGGLCAAKLTGRKVLGIVTDMPGLMVGQQKGGLLTKIIASINRFFMVRCDMYMLLTEQMNAVVNPKNRPYCIVEGMVDINMREKQANPDEKVKTIIYAGGIFEKYGIKMLIDAFREVEGDDLRLVIYGNGTMEKDMPRYMEMDKRFEYRGIVPNAEVVEAQLSATLLVNPRPTVEEFTKYSFPSKNMEYMASGVPLLTTKLPGMPAEYYSYVFLIENESVEGIKVRIEEIVALSHSEIVSLGNTAKAFVMENKNNIVQAEKVIEIIKKKR